MGVLDGAAADHRLDRSFAFCVALLRLNRHHEINQRRANDDEIEYVPGVQNVWTEAQLLHILVVHREAEGDDLDHGLKSEEDGEAVVEVADEDDGRVLRVAERTINNKRN